MQDRYLKNVIEAALLAAGHAVPLEQLLEMFGERDRPEPGEIRAALEQLAQEYAERGIELREVASGFRIQIRSSVTEIVGRLLQERPRRYSRALLETLALIAYRQPITRGEIEEVRGVTVNPDIVRTLFERNWIRVLGHREVPGRPELLGTTRDFLDYFGLKSLGDLPALAELRDMDNLGVQLELPGQEGEAHKVDAILAGDAPEDDASAAPDEDSAENDEHSGSGTPQASGMVARRSDD
ncbi:MAG TPA: SMC-Scp complex subunit ScpB [Steroidobacteraceae bacterium]|nr:SMC-Scp complex subunit ScpB [Steroidobacteraceae bacterium]